MQKRWDYIIDTNGKPVEGATVEVNQYPGGTDATLYSDDGATAITGNILTTDEDGYFEYYAANGRYTWIITTDSDAKTINDIIHDDSLPLTGSATWNPGSLADGDGETSPAITVTGAALGDFVQVSAPHDLQGVIAVGYVSAANTVKIRLQNESGGVVDLASGTWKVAVRQAS
jgi:hypothetical protein